MKKENFWTDFRKLCVELDASLLFDCIGGTSIMKFGYFLNPGSAIIPFGSLTGGP
jgi:hypothetical protein